MEAPIMFVVIVLSARWVARRLVVPPSFAARLPVGLVGLGLLLVAEFAVVLCLRGITIAEYFASRDSVAGAVYLVMLIVFALMPFLVIGRSDL
jgi:hypothetical protein